ncbi:hypothetical protein V8E51_015303 [Hyaloscypha variabilis]
MYPSFNVLLLVLPAVLICQVTVDASLSPFGQVRGRQTPSTGEEYCLDGICSYSETLSSDCQGFSGQSDQTQWYECICGNGFVSANQECIWCQEALNLTDLSLDLWSQSIAFSGCSSAHATIAPVPSSVLASISAWNSSYSSFLATATLTSFGESATTGPTISTSNFGFSTSLSTGNGANSSSWTSTFTLLAPTGDNSIATGAVATATSLGSSPSSSSKGNEGGLRMMNNSVMILLLFSSASSILYML